MAPQCDTAPVGKSSCSNRLASPSPRLALARASISRPAPPPRSSSGPEASARDALHCRRGLAGPERARTPPSRSIRSAGLPGSPSTALPFRPGTPVPSEASARDATAAMTSERATDRPLTDPGPNPAVATARRLRRSSFVVVRRSRRREFPASAWRRTAPGRRPRTSGRTAASRRRRRRGPRARRRPRWTPGSSRRRPGGRSRRRSGGRWPTPWRRAWRGACHCGAAADSHSRRGTPPSPGSPPFAGRDSVTDAEPNPRALTPAGSAQGRVRPRAGADAGAAAAAGAAGAAGEPRPSLHSRRRTP